MRRTAILGLSLVLGYGVAAAGCSTSSPADARSLRPAPVNPVHDGLVMGPRGTWAVQYEDDPASVPPSEASDWESWRNDTALGVRAEGTEPDEFEWLEIRSRDNTWTTNGRVRENSNTRTRTIRRGYLRP